MIEKPAARFIVRIHQHVATVQHFGGTQSLDPVRASSRFRVSIMHKDHLLATVKDLADLSQCIRPIWLCMRQPKLDKAMGGQLCGNTGRQVIRPLNQLPSGDACRSWDRLSQRQEVHERLEGRSTQGARRGFLQVEPHVVVLQDQPSFVYGSGTDEQPCCWTPRCWNSCCRLFGG